VRGFFGLRTAYVLLLALLAVIAWAGLAAEPASPDDAQTWAYYLVPLPKALSILGTVGVAPSAVGIYPPAGPDAVVDQACKELRQSMGLPEDAPNPPSPAFSIILVLGGAEADPLTTLKNSDQAYSINPAAGNTELRLVALSSRGLYYAAKALQQLIKAKATPSLVTMPILTVTDWPDMTDRGLWGSDTLNWLRWMADRKLNIDERVAGRSVTAPGVHDAYLKTGEDALVDEAPLYGIKPSPAIPHMELHESTGLFDVYPNLIAVDAAPGVICYSQPEIVPVLRDWIADLGSLPHVEDVSVWMSENLLDGGGCKCAACSTHNRDVYEAEKIVEGWQQAKAIMGNKGLRLLTSEETRESNQQIFDTIPTETKVWYFDSMYTYSVGETNIILNPVANLAQSGRYAGLVPLISPFSRYFHPFTSGHFVKYRINEAVTKQLSGLLGYAVPATGCYKFNVEAAAEWSWNSTGRSTREFAYSYALRNGIVSPTMFADWAESIGPVAWDIYGSDWPRSERRNWPGPVATRLQNGTLPALGTTNGMFRGPWGDIKTVTQFNDDVSASVRAMELARRMGIPEHRYESIVVNGHITALRALYELKLLMPGGVLDPANIPVANTYFSMYINGLKQAIYGLQNWSTVTLGSSSYVTDSVTLLNDAISGMQTVAANVGCTITYWSSYNAVGTIPGGKCSSNGVPVHLSEVKVTSNANGYYYVQEADGRAGIRVTSSLPLTVGNSIYLSGTMSTTSSERVITALGAITFATGQPASPILVRTKWLGGEQFGLQVGVKEYVDGQTVYAVGLNNIGLLVTITGRVTKVGTDYFYVDDGCQCDDKSGTGVRVLSGSFSEPPLDSYLVVTGISTMHYVKTGPWRAVLLRHQDDWQTCQP